MAALTLRSTNGAPLTNSQVDANFTNLNADIQTRATLNFAPESMANLLINSSAELGNQYWTGAAIPTNGSYGEGQYWFMPNATTATNFSQVSNNISLNAGQLVYLQAEMMALGMTAGSVFVQLAYYSSGGTLLSVSSPLTIPNGNSWTYVNSSFILPTSTTYVQIQFGYTGGVNTNAAIRRIKLSQSLSFYSNEATMYQMQFGSTSTTFNVANATTNSHAMNYGQATGMFAPLTGSGASGTWGISISGNAATATNATNATLAAQATALQNTRTINGVGFNGSGNITVTANTPTALTLSSSGNGVVSGSTFNGSTATVISYNSIGAPSLTGSGASGTWGISITGNAATATNATNATNATTALNLNGGTVNASTGVFAGNITANSRVMLSNGSATAPSLAWSSDGSQDTGFYWSADGYTNMTNNGVYSGQFGPGGTLVMVGNISANSDERLKTNWKSLPKGIIQQLSCVKSGTFDRIDRKDIGRQVGVGAQSLQKILSEAVGKDSKGILNVNYGAAALALLVEAAKEIEALKERILELEGK